MLFNEYIIYIIILILLIFLFIYIYIYIIILILLLKVFTKISDKQTQQAKKPKKLLNTTNTEKKREIYILINTQHTKTNQIRK